MKIQYNEGNETLLSFVKPLWEKTRDFHSSISPYFSEKFSSQNFEWRKEGLLEQAQNGQMKVSLAKDLENDRYIGYCISVISNREVGEIESIYIEEEYRRNGIASNLMNRALSWMDENSVKSKKISIAVGNEEVIKFYQKFGFYPYHISCESID